MSDRCPLCQGKSRRFYESSKQLFNICSQCDGIFRDQSQLLRFQEEKERYINHVSSLEDMGYYLFISPIIDEVNAHFSKNSLGLDFGCGHTPVLSKHLLKAGFKVLEYDPVFFKNHDVLDKKYDFIVSCEVIEHFYHPKKEFKQLFHMLKDDGKLICKTHPYNDGINFADWYYKNDPTHVFIYQDSTFEWIQKAFNIRSVKINDRLISFTK